MKGMGIVADYCIEKVALFIIVTSVLLPGFSLVQGRKFVFVTEIIFFSSKPYATKLE